MHVCRVHPDQAAAATAVLCDAFADYPVMRFVLGHRDDFRQRLSTLIGYFVASRFLRRDLVLGLSGPGSELHGVALVTLPTQVAPPPELASRREAVWEELGADARARYETFGAATQQFERPEPHHHLNMLGVPALWAGQGFGRLLLDDIHARVDSSSHSTGISLTTETPSNVPLYRHFEYQLQGHVLVAPGLETWGLHRPKHRAAVT
jgi:GNAT superfamily N-acetyltransferase